MSPFVLQILNAKADEEFNRLVAGTTDLRALSRAAQTCKFRGLASRRWTIEARIKEIQTSTTNPHSQ